MPVALPVRRRRKRPAIVLNCIDWRTYSRILKIFEHRRGTRMAYDRGSLEIMSPLFEHESDGAMIACFVSVLSDELDIPIKSAGSTTFRRKAKKRGIEADQSWWVQNETKMRGKRKVDLDSDPPPDLALEVDVTHSSLDKMGIYAALGVPEVWRADSGLSFQALQPDGTYAPIPRSLAFPLVTPADLEQFLALTSSIDETSVVRQFRAWVRQQIGKGTASP